MATRRMRVRWTAAPWETLTVDGVVMGWIVCRPDRKEWRATRMRDLRDWFAPTRAAARRALLAAVREAGAK